MGQSPDGQAGSYFRKAFVNLGYGDFESLENMEFVPGWTSFNIGGGIELDILTKMEGLDELTFSD